MTKPNFPNRTLYHGDNLTFLRGINSGTVNLIYADPPFNKNKDFHATPDNIASGAKFTDRWRWDVDVHRDWIDAIKDDWPGVWSVIEASRVASGDDMAAFLCWLGVRLLETHRVLRDDGSIYLHIDRTAHAWTKALMDGIFGRKQFRNEIVWFYDDAPGRSNRYFRASMTRSFGIPNQRSGISTMAMYGYPLSQHRLSVTRPRAPSAASLTSEARPQ